jgi:reverse transcriptase-like protein
MNTNPVRNLNDLYTNLNMLHAPLKSINKAEFSDIQKRAELITLELEHAQTALHSDPLNENLINEEAKIREQASLIYEAEIRFLQQRTKSQLLRDGDKPSKLFYGLLKARQFKNHILCLSHNGTLLQSRDQVEAHLVDFFSNQLGTSVPPTASVDLSVIHQGPCLSNEHQLQLIQPFTATEIHNALKSIPDGKSPGADGFSSQFFKASWHIIGSSVVEAVKDFFNGGIIPEQLNHTIITLLPKKDHPQLASDYRPISCCSVLYKVIAKVLCTRLSSVLPSIIHGNQGAFVKGRLISHNVLLTQELLHTYNWKYGSMDSCMLKLDIQKAFDNVEWSFLFSLLQGLKFPKAFITWIRRCVETASFSLSLNGGYSESFRGRRGVKQGDPLSPLLFVISMEYLSRLVSLAFQQKKLDYHTKCRATRIQCLLFADDLLMFCKANQKSLQGVKAVLSDFGAVSGLSINPAKSQAYFSRMEQSTIDSLLGILQVQRGILPVSYLGLPISGTSWTTLTCQKLVDKLNQVAQMEG